MSWTLPLREGQALDPYDLAVEKGQEDSYQWR